MPKSNTTKEQIKKQKNAIPKKSFYLLNLMEIIFFLSALLALLYVRGSGQFVYMIDALCLFGVGLVFLIAEIVLRIRTRYYDFYIGGKRIVYDKKHTNDTVLYEKHKKFYEYVIKEDDVTQIKNFGLFKIIYGKVEEKTMLGREVEFKNTKDKLIVPYWADRGQIKASGLSQKE